MVTRNPLLTRREFSASLLAAPARAPNILTIICDQLNPAVTSVYGGPVPAPNMERLARRGVVFTNATCPTPFCSPSRASLVTGRWPHAHRIVHNVSRIDYPAITSPSTEQGLLASDITADQLLHRAGYSTHQYGKWHLSGDPLAYYPDQYGEHREYAREMAGTFSEIRRRAEPEWMNWYGWILPVTCESAYRNSFPPDDPIRQTPYRDFITKIGRLDLSGDQVFDARVTSRTIDRIRSAASNPFSITCSLNWPHDPNVIHSPYYEMFDPSKIELPATLNQREPRFEDDLSRRMVAAAPLPRLREFLRVYYASVRFIDDQLGRILDALDAAGLTADTVTIFTSDHGDMTGGHGMAWKSTSSFYEEIVRIPLIMSWPGRFHPSRPESAASLTDLAPTILDLAGRPIPESMQGTSLAPILRGSSSARNRYVYRFSERVRPNAGRTRNIAAGTPVECMVRGAGWKYIRYSDGGDYLYQLSKDPGENIS